MALFGIKKNTKEKENVAPNVPAEHVRAVRGLSHVLRHTRITEKATMHQNASVYVFNVDTDATKRDIAEAIKAVYGVRPRKIRIAPVPSKKRRSMRTGVRGLKSGGKKAYVYLKKGETITIT